MIRVYNNNEDAKADVKSVSSKNDDDNGLETEQYEYLQTIFSAFTKEELQIVKDAKSIVIAIPTPLPPSHFITRDFLKTHILKPLVPIAKPIGKFYYQSVWWEENNNNNKSAMTIEKQNDEELAFLLVNDTIKIVIWSEIEVYITDESVGFKVWLISESLVREITYPRPSFFVAGNHDDNNSNHGKIFVLTTMNEGKRVEEWNTNFMNYCFKNRIQHLIKPILDLQRMDFHEIFVEDLLVKFVRKKVEKAILDSMNAIVAYSSPLGDMYDFSLARTHSIYKQLLVENLRKLCYAQVHSNLFSLTCQHFGEMEQNLQTKLFELKKQLSPLADAHEFAPITEEIENLNDFRDPYTKFACLRKSMERCKKQPNRFQVAFIMASPSFVFANQFYIKSFCSPIPNDARYVLDFLDICVEIIQNLQITEDEEMLINNLIVSSTSGIVKKHGMSKTGKQQHLLLETTTKKQNQEKNKRLALIGMTSSSSSLAPPPGKEPTTPRATPNQEIDENVCTLS